MKLVVLPASYSQDIRQLQDIELIKDLQSNLVRTGYLASLKDVDGIAGINTCNAFIAFKKDNYLEHPFILGKSTANELLSQGNSPQVILISRPQFDEIFRYSSKANRDRYFDPINRACGEFKINTKKRLAAFLAQICHESGSLRYSEEIASGEAYEGRRDLGNIYPGDGVRFKGRGPIQITGRTNYQRYGQALGLDLLNNPQQASIPSVGSRIAALYWRSHGLNELADDGDFRGITKRINGGYNGLQDRIDHWNRAKEVLS